MKIEKITLQGTKDEVVEQLLVQLSEEQEHVVSFFNDMQQILLIRSVELLKILENDNEGSKLLTNGQATFEQLHQVILNTDGVGERLAEALSEIKTDDALLKKNAEDISAWFLEDYFTGSNVQNTQVATTTYKHASSLHEVVKKWMEQK